MKVLPIISPKDIGVFEVIPKRSLDTDLVEKENIMSRKMAIVNQGIGLFFLTLMLSGCLLLQPKKYIDDTNQMANELIDTVELKARLLLDSLDQNIGGLGENLVQGAFNGIDTTKLKETLSSIVGSLQNELDSVTFSKLQDSLDVALGALLDKNLGRLNSFLQDPTLLEGLEGGIDEIVSGILLDFQATLEHVIPSLLTEENKEELLALKESLIGEETAQQLRNTLRTALTGLTESEALDRLISRITKVVESTTDEIEGTTVTLSKAITKVGWIIALVLALAIGFLVLWLRRRAISKQQKELSADLTIALDAIPSRAAYDHTIHVLQERLNQSKYSNQHEMLRQILEEYKDQYTQKKKYKDYHQMLIEKLRKTDTNGTILRQLMEEEEDEDFKSYLEGELE